MAAIPAPRLSMRGCNVPTVTILGACGHGKSTVVEKATGLKGLSSAAPTSCTTLSSTYRSTCGRLQVVDTPGMDATAEDVHGRVRNSLQIASALSSCPVALLIVVVKAETRLDSVISVVRRLSDNFLEFDKNLAVCVTHMDQITWSEAECSRHLKTQLDLDLTVFSRIDTPGNVLVDRILGLCGRVGKPLNFTIDSENFLQYFQIQDCHRGILRTVKREVGLFQKLIQEFHGELGKLPQEDQPDCVFEFQTFMKDEIDQVCKRVTDEHDLGEALISNGEPCQINAIGHLASLKMQLRSVLVSVRRFALQYQSDAGVSDLRKCPHCGEIWAKIDGCPDTTCGNLMNWPDARRETMATFTFEIRNQSIVVKRAGKRDVKVQHGSRKGAGCGKSIKWYEMKPVQAPPELSFEVTPTAHDVMLVDKALKKSWLDYYALRCAEVQRQQPELSFEVTPTSHDVMLVDKAIKKSWLDYYGLQCAEVQRQK